jgi:hypothetical protein
VPDPAPAPITRPSAPELADLIHGTLAGTVDRPHVVGISCEAEGDLALALWEVPATLRDPIAPLVGYRAPSTWEAIALTCTGRRHDLSQPGLRPAPVATTVVRARSGACATVISSGDEPWERIGTPPEGPVADVLARVLGCATPPPEHTSAVLIDLTWLERIARSHPNRSRRHLHWAHLADRHPMRRSGPTPSPEELRARAAQTSAESPWSHLLERHRTVPLPAAQHGPPGGDVLTADEWFDEGSMCRWSMRQSLPVPELLEAALSPLASAEAQQVRAALAELGATARRAR